MSIAFTSPSVLSGLPADTPLLVAFSGGADSRLLLELTAEWARTAGAPITAAHLHHGIRGAEADRDEAFCRDTAAALGIPYVCRRVDIPARSAQSGRSLELEARDARYDFFEQIMKERGIPLLLTAHHADDQLETLLLRLLRGSGTHGLSGIPAVRSVPGGLLLRPLLSATRQDILDACRERKLSFVTDSTNLQDGCRRNCLRHRIIPLLEDVAGAGVPQRTATRLCDTVREDDDYLTCEAARTLPSVMDPESGSLSVEALERLHPALAKRCILLAYDRARLASSANGSPRSGEHSIEAVHLQALTRLVRDVRQSAAVSLPGGWQGTVRSGQLVFLPPGTLLAPHGAESPDGTRLLSGDTVWCAGGHCFRVRLEEADQPLPALTGIDVVSSAVFPADLPRPLILRRRAPGDTIFSHGMRKKLKKLLCDRHIPADLRDALPLVCLPEMSGFPPEPLWFPTVAFRDGWMPPASGACLRLTVFRT